MRIIVLIIALIAVSKLSAQLPLPKTTITGIVVAADSLPVPGVAVINIHTGKTVRTNAAGFFRAEITGNDSLLVYHISYQKLYINKNDNGKLIVLEPEIQEIKQVDVVDKQKQELRNLDETMNDINRLAPLEKLSGYERHSAQEYFILENGSQTRGFSPFFGPTIHIPLEKVTERIGKTDVQKDQKGQASNYKLSKKKKKADKINTSAPDDNKPLKPIN